MEVPITADSVLIKDVWRDNLEAEFVIIRAIIDDYPYIATDTEFPGMVVQRVPKLERTLENNFLFMMDNVNRTKLIQLGLTFSDEKGNLPKCGTDKYHVWQFNFCEFKLEEDNHLEDSIQLLQRCGIDFEKNNEKGVDSLRFAELLMSSGLVLNNSVFWVTFHCGFDFGYLLKLLTAREVPKTKGEFFKLIRMYVPNLYDVKHLIKFCNGIHGGLETVARQLGIARIGVSHQAGSDSLLTICAFMKLKEVYFGGSVEQYAGVMHGLNEY